MKLLSLSVLFSSFLLLSCNKADKKKTETTNPLTGSWNFIADEELDGSGKVANQDTAVTGLLVYGSDGKMSAQLLWKGTRAPIINDTIMNQDGMPLSLGLGNNSWSLEQSRKLIDTYSAYFGDYSVDTSKNWVTHTITGNLRPEKAGSSYPLLFRIKGDSLFLRSTHTDLRWQTTWIRNKNK